ncbi:uncharacterized protein FIBRA_00046 [Fibroporia radiculosa]|uniref:Uracil-DNA glycosylase-like domain-containing protein n=1 Tax=Fibroporia radiculosa TaxID=599839 RepID=J7RG19_9APHY|nr:uncharacterized protein FIBRA_00046 [Fibroporia radiculosa]CCL98052.1 predicted protein [Fibroporia radiculosa]
MAVIPTDSPYGTNTDDTNADKMNADDLDADDVDAEQTDVDDVDVENIDTEKEDTANLKGFSAMIASFTFSPTQAAARRSPRFSSIQTQVEDILPLTQDFKRRKPRRELDTARLVKPRFTEMPKEEGLGATKAQKAKVTLKAKVKRSYAPPETYAHLQPLPDYLKEGLDILFCGINPSVKSATAGHHYANPTNHFWRCLHRSGTDNDTGPGLTPAEQALPPSEDHTLPERFNLGMTNIVDRPSAEANELSPAEMRAGVPVLLSKITRFRPRIVCFVGRSIWEAFYRVLVGPPSSRSQPATSIGDETEGLSGGASNARAEASEAPSGKTKKARPKELKRRSPTSKAARFDFGIQPYKVVHPDNDNFTIRETLFFVLPSTSGRVVRYQLADKIAMCANLKQRLEALTAGSYSTTAMTVIPVVLNE